MIAFSCAQCGTKLKVKEQFAGRQSKCPTCKQPLVVPAASATAAFVAPRQIDGAESGLAKAGLDGGVTLCQHEAGKPGKPLRDALAGRKNGKDRYVVEGEIARGGMGAVLRAIDCDIRREVAVKYLLDQSDPKKMARFIEEAQVTGQLEHPNIVPIYDLGVDAHKRLFFSMKIVKGRSLKEVLDQLREQARPADKEYSLGRLLNILVNICNALACAHSRGVVHRDLKPANIMLGDFGEVYVMDWGLAKVLGDDRAAPVARTAASVAPPSPAALPVRSSKIATSREPEADLTQEGAVMGTPVYMPPEQAAGKVQAIDQRSDIYSLGAMLYEMLTGQPPVGRDGGYLAVLLRVMEGAIVPPEQRRPGKVPPELSAVCMKALAKDPADRYPTVQAFRQDIERFQEGRSVSAKQDTTREMLWKLIKRNQAVSAALFVLLPLLVVLCGFTLVNYLAYAREQKEKDDRTRQAVPALVRSARMLANDGQFPESATQIELALTYDPDNADARLLKGQSLIAQKSFAAGRAELDQYLRLRADDADAKKLGELAERAKVDDVVALVALAEVLQRQKAYGLAAHLLSDVNRTLEARKPLVALYQKQIEAAWPGLGSRLTLEKNSEIRLNFNHCKQVAALDPLKGMQLNTLDMVACDQITDLSPLRGMPLTSLSLNGCRQLRDLSPLQGLTKLTALDLASCELMQDLSPLRGSKLTSLNLSSCWQVSDLSALRGMPLTTLHLAGCTQVHDLSPLQGMPLTTLNLQTCPKVQDLSPLRGMPIANLTLFGCTQVSDLGPLQGMKFTRLNLIGCGLVTDLSPLQGLPLTHLNLMSCKLVRDLTPLRGMPLSFLNVINCQVQDFTPLQDMNLTELGIVPRATFKGLDGLRRMKSLKSFDAGLGSRYSAEEFWKKFDAGDFK